MTLEQKVTQVNQERAKEVELAKSRYEKAEEYYQRQLENLGKECQRLMQELKEVKMEFRNKESEYQCQISRQFYKSRESGRKIATLEQLNAELEVSNF